MRTVRRLAWAAVAAAATTGPAAAQQQGGGGGGQGTGNTGGNIPTFQTAPTTTTPTPTTTSSSGSSDSGAFTQPLLEQSIEKAPILRSPSTYGATNSNKAVQNSNFLAPSFANPYAQGVLQNARNADYNPGGFGALTFGTATGPAGTGATATRTGGAAGGLTTDPGGQLVTLPRQIAYTAQLKFATPALPAPRLQADLRGVIDRAGLKASPAGVQVTVDGNAVVLRGAVADADDARLVEGLVRLTPGVGRISNELAYPR